MTEKEVRDIVKSVLKSQMIDFSTKDQTRKIAKEESEKVFKKISDDTLTKKEVKEMIINTFHAYHKWMWEKKGMWMNQI